MSTTTLDGASQGFGIAALLRVGAALARLPAVRREDWAQLAADALAGAAGPTDLLPTLSPVLSPVLSPALSPALSPVLSPVLSPALSPVVAIVDVRDVGPVRVLSVGWGGEPVKAAAMPRGFHSGQRSGAPIERVVEGLVAVLGRAGCGDVRCVAAMMPPGIVHGTRRIVALAMVGPGPASATRAPCSGLAEVCAALAGAAERALGRCEDRPWLTPHEVAVLDRLAQGQTVEEIATALHRSPHTIHDHTKSLHRKLGVERRAILVARALGAGESATGPDGGGLLRAPVPTRPRTPGEVGA